MKNKIIRTSTVSISLYKLLKGQLAYLNNHYNVIAVANDNNYLNKVKEREDVKVYKIEFNRRISFIKDFISLLKLYQLFRKEKPLIVHSITPKAGLLSMIAAKFAGVPIRIHTFTGLIFPSRKYFMKWLLLNMDRLLCICATDIYPEGNGIKRDLINYKVTKKKLKVLVNGNINGIDPKHFDPYLFINEREKIRKTFNISRKEIVYIFIGRLVSEKGINELVKAFLEIQNMNNSCKLLLVGSFEKEIDCLNISIEKEIYDNPNIIYVGYQEDIRPYLIISDIFVFPSYREGFPNAVMQAGCFNLPCIVTNINGCNEIIINNINGIIIESRNIEQLKEKMLLLLNDSALRKKLSINARDLILKRYDQKEIWDEILNEYKRLENKLHENII